MLILQNEGALPTLMQKTLLHLLPVSDKSSTSRAFDKQLPDFIDFRHGTTVDVYGDQLIYNFIAIDDAGITQPQTCFRTSKANGNIAEKTRRDIHTWLSPPDPRLNQTDAIKKRGPETGLWFINGPLFKEWKAAAHSFLWIHGIRKSTCTLVGLLVCTDDGDSWLRQISALVG